MKDAQQVNLKILPSARLRLIEVWNYTSETWGEEQADTYIRKLHSEFKRISTRPEIWKKLPQNRFRGVFFFHSERHYLFFRRLDEHMLGLISVLHERMNLPSRLLEDL